jgi:hypothetical protein
MSQLWLITIAPYSEMSLMAITNAEKQARWRERHLKNENGTKMPAQFIFDASTRAQLKRIAWHKGCS